MLNKKILFLIMVLCIFMTEGYKFTIWGDLDNSGNSGDNNLIITPTESPTSDVDRKLSFNKMEIVGLIMTAFFVAIAAGGGIGGGGVLVPTYIFIFGFSPKIAIPLSTITILGSSIANLVLNVHKRHPSANRPLIDWDMMLVMEPLTIAGTVLGSFINVLCPPWLLCIMLVLLLSLTTIKTGLKGIKMYKKETSTRRQSEISSLLEADIKIVEDYGSHQQQQPSGQPLSKSTTNKLCELYESESIHSGGKIATMLFLTCGVLGFTILKGGNGINPMSVTCGTWQYWIISLSVLPFVVIISTFARNYLLRKYHLKKLIGFNYVEGDVEWNEINTIKYPLICSIAGLCAGLFGIGGGIVKGPLMLQMGTQPKVASATSATMILLTSSSAATSYFLFNSLNLNFLPFLFCIGFLFTICGQKILNHFVKKYNRSSLIVIIIAITVGCSAIAMGIQSGGSFIDFINGKQVQTSSLC